MMTASACHYSLLWPTFKIIYLSLLISSTTSNAAPTKHRKEAIWARHGAVATDDGRCSRVGKDVLREGGHAVDAAVASALCLGVVSPASSGIGGGAFMIVRLASGEARAYDMRETAPLLAFENMYGGNASLKARGGLSIAVPGELAGLHKAWKHHGKLPWERLVRPAERFSRLGFKISPYLEMQLTSSKESVLRDEGLQSIFSSNGRTLLKAGDLCRNKKLAQTLREISKFGVKAFYNGSVGFNLVRDIRKSGGVITMKDLQRYRVKVKRPIFADVAGLRLLAMPPPSGGPPMILMLNILSQFGFPYGVSGSLGVHRIIEAMKHTFSVRMNLGDPDFASVTKVLSDMLSPKFAEELRQTINDNKTFNSSHYGGKWNQVHDHGTSHLAIIDDQQNVVSMTSTVNSYFGSKIMSTSTGIVLNNEMDDFSIPVNVSARVLPPAPVNFIRPGKRPLSSMSPTIVLKDNQVKAVLGASGGAMIFSAVVEVFLNYFARGMDPLSSIMAPRIYHQLMPNVVNYENWTTVIGDHFEVPANIREALEKKGHVLKEIAGGTICQLIVQNAENLKGNKHFGDIKAVSDPRKGGFPAGF